MDEYLTTRDITKLLKVKGVTVRRWIRKGELKAVNLGKEYRIQRQDFEDFINSRKTQK